MAYGNEGTFVTFRRPDSPLPQVDFKTEGNEEHYCEVATPFDAYDVKTVSVGNVSLIPHNMIQVGDALYILSFSVVPGISE